MDKKCSTKSAVLSDSMWGFAAGSCKSITRMFIELKKTVSLTLEIKHLRNGMPESQFVLIWSKLSYDRLKLTWG